MSDGPKIWLGYVSATAASAAEPFPTMLEGDLPAVCLSLDDLPPATGADPATPMADSSHEWNVARFRKITVCFSDGSEGTAYVLMTAPVSGGV